jgi:putative FmdB family regulatory protein
MPLYEYQCEACEQRFERIQKFSDPPVETCPACSGRVRKLLSSPAIQFKGSGWYITDYAKKGGGGDKGAGAGSDGDTSKSDGARKTDGGATASADQSSSPAADKTATKTTSE